VRSLEIWHSLLSKTVLSVHKYICNLCAMCTRTCHRKCKILFLYHTLWCSRCARDGRMWFGRPGVIWERPVGRTPSSITPHMKMKDPPLYPLHRLRFDYSDGVHTLSQHIFLLLLAERRAPDWSQTLCRQAKPLFVTICGVIMSLVPTI
jgi:hypothetical protein